MTFDPKLGKSESKGGSRVNQSRTDNNRSNDSTS
jgi:hypothetical protein